MPSARAAEPEFDEEGRMIISSPLAPPSRPAPTIIYPAPATAFPRTPLLARRQTFPPTPASERTPKRPPITPDDIPFD
jgi:hypothetical protein